MNEECNRLGNMVHDDPELVGVDLKQWEQFLRRMGIVETVEEGMKGWGAAGGYSYGYHINCGLTGSTVNLPNGRLEGGGSRTT